MPLALHPQVDTQAACDGCFPHQSICSVISLYPGLSRAVHLHEFLKVDVNHCGGHGHIPVWASHSTFHPSLSLSLSLSLFLFCHSLSLHISLCFKDFIIYSVSSEYMTILFVCMMCTQVFIIIPSISTSVTSCPSSALFQTPETKCK